MFISNVERKAAGKNSRNPTAANGKNRLHHLERAQRLHHLERAQRLEPLGTAEGFWNARCAWNFRPSGALAY